MMGFASAVDDWASLVIAVTWQLAALTVVALVCEKALRLRPPRVRYALWWFALIAPLLVTPGRMALQRRQAMISVQAPAAAMKVVTWEVGLRPTPDARTATAMPPAIPPGSFAPLKPALRPVDLLGLAWLAGCAALALRLAVGHRRVRRLLAESLPTETESAREMLSGLAAQAGIRGEVALRVSEAVGSPVLYGWRRPMVVVPKGWLESLAVDEVRAILAHEVAHVRRRDFLANTIQRLIEIPLFFHPGAWLASRRITLAREELCDSWALSLGTDAASYARSLAAVAERTQAAFAPVSLGIAESRFTLLRRVEAIMTMGSVKRISRPLLIAVIAVGLISAAALAAVKVTGEPRRESARHAEASAVSPAEPAAAAPATRTVIRGLLTAPDGRPASGVTVHMEGAFDSRRTETHPNQAVTTGKNGRFELTLTGPGKRTVWVFDERYYAILAREVDSRTGGTLTLAPVTLQKSARVSGRVLNAEGGRPLSGIRIVSKPILKSGVIPSSIDIEAESAADGEFVVAAPPGTAWLQAIGAGGYTWSHVVENTTLIGHPGLRVRGDLRKPTDRRVEVRPGEVLTGVDLFLEPAASVEGVVLGPDGKRWEHNGHVYATAEVDRVVSEMYVFGLSEFPADGAFRIEDLPSETPIAVWMIDEERGLGGAALVTTSVERTPNVTLRLHPLATLRGRVVRMDGSAVANADLAVEDTRRLTYFDRGPVHMRSRADGTFEVVMGIAGLPTRVRAAYPPSSPGGPYAEYFGESRLFSVTPGQIVVDLGDVVITKPVRSGRALGVAGAGSGK
jgi:beta-lactamase regulating signal transducer with metallopeptidase domain